jgi:hypothetical protein
MCETKNDFLDLQHAIFYPPKNGSVMLVGKADFVD